MIAICAAMLAALGGAQGQDASELTSAAWTSTTLGGESADMAVAVYAGRLYVLGGYDSATATAAVRFAPLGGDGSIGSFTTTTSLPLQLGAISAAVDSGRGVIYVSGGNVDALYQANINASDGTIGAWTTTPNEITSAPYGAGLVFDQDFLFSIGGAHVTGGASTTTTTFSESRVAHVSASTTTWAGGPALPSARVRHGLAAVPANGGGGSGWLYVVGGFDSSNNEVATVYMAQYATGELGSWTTTTPLPSARSSPAVFAYGGFLYAIGGRAPGFTPLDDALQARINSNGTLGPWVPAHTLPAPRSLAGAATNNGYGYVVGGFTTAYATDVLWKKLDTPKLAAKLGYSGLGASVHSGDCVQVIVTAKASDDSDTWVDQATSITLAATGGAKFFPAGTTYNQCLSGTNGTSSGTASIAAGSGTSAVVQMRTGSAGTNTITASATGLTAGQIGVTVTAAVADGGTEDTTVDDAHTVNGWGCTSSGPMGAVFGLLAMCGLGFRKRRS
ncbi:MAG: hypothetical protein JST92_02245 [Deltaproteobacteria bacterium]|nr:hypothetical protein [Deltaproteobacteria bacterium]